MQFLVVARFDSDSMDPQFPPIAHHSNSLEETYDDESEEEEEEDKQDDPNMFYPPQCLDPPIETRYVLRSLSVEEDIFGLSYFNRHNLKYLHGLYSSYISAMIAMILPKVRAHSRRQS
jgi:hypothetical protein